MLEVIFSRKPEGGRPVVKIMDIRGSKIIEKIFDLGPDERIQLDVTGLTTGQYFLSLENSKGILYSKAFLKR